MFTGEIKMKKILIVGLMLVLLLTVGCDIELGHSDDEGHDHDGDGFEDHTAEDHYDDHEDKEHEGTIS